VRVADASASLLGLLRAGEQSAYAAMARILRHMAPGAGALACTALAPIALDERRHDHWLGQLDSWLVVPAQRPSPEVRRFFQRMHSTDPALHLARVAALDGCVCQVLYRVLTAPGAGQLDVRLLEVLSAIRLDESRHVRVTRQLAAALGVRADWARVVNLETRHDFGNVLEGFRASFEGLGVDFGDLRSRICRDDN
jgi:hypothetical protein